MSKATRQRTARERLAEERKRQDERRRRLRALLISGGALVVAAIVVAAVVLVQSGGDSGDDDAPIALPPVTRQADGSVVMAKAGVTAPVLEIYEDFQCPACKQAEAEISRTYKELAAEGKAKVVFRPFSLFRTWPEPTKGNSARALNASFCAPADKWVAYHDKLFAEQGPESESGFSNQQLISWAGDVGITGSAFASCVNGNQKAAQMEQANAAATKAGVDSTPWLTLDGKKLDQNASFTADGLRSAVEAVAGQG